MAEDEAIKDIRKAKEAYKEKAEREELEAAGVSKAEIKKARRKKEDEESPKQQATGTGGSTFSPKVLLENVKKPHFWAWVFVIIVILIVSWYYNFLHVREVLTGYGFTILGLVT